MAGWCDRSRDLVDIDGYTLRFHFELRRSARSETRLQHNTHLFQPYMLNRGLKLEGGAPVSYTSLLGDGKASYLDIGDDRPHAWQGCIYTSGRR